MSDPEHPKPGKTEATGDSSMAGKPRVWSGTQFQLNRVLAEQPDLKTTEVHQWNFVVQRQFGKDWVASATYTGSETEHLLASYQVNRIDLRFVNAELLDDDLLDLLLNGHAPSRISCTNL